jgi:mannose-6-phosphate isomerase-like protein (cupin superfamily)
MCETQNFSVDETWLPQQPVASEAKSQSLSFILTETHPGGGPPLHRHGCEEAHVLLEGSARYLIGERTFTAQAPYVVRIPANVPHTFMNTGDRVFRLIAVLPGQKISYTELGPNPLVKKNP